MKRKIFSKLLMVALVIAAVGSFVSCKDYDDDINNLQKQIDNAALKSDLTALQQTLTSVQSTATKAASDATSALTKAGANASDIAALQTKATELGTQIATAAQNATKGVEDAAKAQAAADAAKTAAQEAKDAIAPAIKAAVDELTEKINAKADTATVSALAKKLADAETDLAAAKVLIAANAAAITALETKADDFETRIAALEAKTSGEGAADVMGWTKVITNVELVPSKKSGLDYLEGSELYFLNGVEVDNAFGAEEAPAGNAAIPYDGNTISEIKNYKAGDKIKFDNRIYVRVYPANATFTADDVVLMNSKGEALNDLVSVSVEPYTKLITRGDYNTGLWVVSFTRKADATEDNFFSAAGSADGKKYDSKKNRLVPSKSLYAIGINNSQDAAAQRYVSTAFEIGVNYGDYVPQDKFTFTVTDAKATNNITALHNRWDGTVEKLIGEDKTAEKVVPGKWNAELVWADKSDDNASVYANHVDTASVSGQTATKYRNWKYGDSRYAKETYVVVDKDSRTFTINGIEPTKLLSKVDLNLVQYYYVTLDRYAAVESAPSEWEAWKSYSYTGLYTITPAIEHLDITIDSEAAVGDIIGFRVFAVNYDGSLADPDGMAFYVQVGEAAAAAELVITGELTAYKQNDATSLVTGNMVKKGFVGNVGVIPATLSGYKYDAALDAKDAENNAVALAADADFSTIAKATKAGYALLKEYNATAGTYTLAKKLSEVKFIAVGLQDAGQMKDGATVTLKSGIKVKDADHHDNVVNTITIKMKKNMPASAPAGFSWKEGRGAVGSALTLYMEPAGGNWNVLAATGSANLNSYANGLDANYKFTFTDADASKDGKTAATADEIDVIGNPTTTTLTLQGPAGTLATGKKTPVGDGKSYATALKYVYGKISYGTKDADGDEKFTVADIDQDYEASVWSGNTTFSYELAENTYELATYTYYTNAGGAGAADVKHTSQNYFIKYSTNLPAVHNAWLQVADMNGAGAATVQAWEPAIPGMIAWDATALKPGNWTTPADDNLWIVPATNFAAAGQLQFDFASLIVAKNAKFSARNNQLFDINDYVLNGLECTKGGLPAGTMRDFLCEFVTASDAEDYFTVYPTATSGTNTMFFALSGDEAPTLDVQHYLKITTKDAFGQVKEVVNVPIMLKH